eukprot:g46766.t1
MGTVSTIWVPLQSWHSMRTSDCPGVKGVVPSPSQLRQVWKLANVSGSCAKEGCEEEEEDGGEVEEMEEEGDEDEEEGGGKQEKDFAICCLQGRLPSDCSKRARRITTTCMDR